MLCLSVGNMPHFIIFFSILVQQEHYSDKHCDAMNLLEFCSFIMQNQIEQNIIKGSL